MGCRYESSVTLSRARVYGGRIEQVRGRRRKPGDHVLTCGVACLVVTSGRPTIKLGEASTARASSSTRPGACDGHGDGAGDSDDQSDDGSEGGSEGSRWGNIQEEILSQREEAKLLRKVCPPVQPPRTLRPRARQPSYRPSQHYLEQMIGIRLPSKAFFGKTSRRAGLVKNVSSFQHAISALKKRNQLTAEQTAFCKDELQKMLDTRRVKHIGCHKRFDAKR